MIKNEKTKKNIVIASIFLLVAIVFGLNFLNSIDKDSEEKKQVEYLMPIKILLADSSQTPENVKLDEIFNKYIDSFLYTANNILPLEKENDFYVVNVKDYINDYIYENISDYVFAKNNINGEVIDDAKYDKETGKISIPASYFSDKKINPVQIEYVSRISDLDLKNIKVSLNVDNKKKDIFLDTRNDEIEFSIAKYGELNKISKKYIKINVNNSSKLLNNTFDYNSKSGLVKLDYSPIFIKSIDVKVENKNIFQKIKNTVLGIINVFASASDTYNSSQVITLTGKPNLSQGSSGTFDATTYYYEYWDDDDTVVNPNWSSANHGNKDPLSLSNNFYGTTTEAWSAITNTSNTFVNATEFDNPLFAANVGDSSFNSKLKLPSGNKFLMLECVHISSASNFSSEEDGRSMPYKYKVLYFDATNRKMTIAFMSTEKQWNQAAWGIHSFTWTEPQDSSIKVTKYERNKSTTGSTRMSENWVFNLYSNSSCTSLVSTKTISKNSSNTVSFTGLSRGKTYYIKENMTNDQSSEYNITFKVGSGSETNTNCKSVTTSSSGSSVSVTAYNTKRYWCTRIEKVDSTNSTKKLTGASFEVKTSDDNTIVSSSKEIGNGIYEFDYIERIYYNRFINGATGYLKVVETTAPKGYNKMTNGTPPNNASNYVEMTYNSGYKCSINSSQKTYSDNPIYYCLKIKKVDEDGNPVQGAKIKASPFTSTVLTTNTKEAITDSNGIASFFFTKKYSTYSVQEIEAPDGYILDNSSRIVNSFQLGNFSTESSAESYCYTENAVDVNDNPIYQDIPQYKIVNKTVQSQLKSLTWYKESNNPDASLSGAKFTVKKDDNTVIRHSNVKESLIDSSNNEFYCYVYDENGTSDIFKTDENGFICISGLEDDTSNYTITETDPLPGHTFGPNRSIVINASSIIENKTNYNKFLNYSTKVIFEKKYNSDSFDSSSINLNIDGVDTDITLTELKKYELKNITYSLYDSNDNIVSLKKNSNGNYSYILDDNSDNKLVLDDNLKITINLLPIGSYKIKENIDDICNNSNCIGYYPENNSKDIIVTDTYSDSSINTSIKNISTEINFTKKDLYGYIAENETVDFVDEEEMNAFDSIKFKIYKNNSNTPLRLIKVSGDCTSSSSSSIYRYVDQDLINNNTGATEDLYTCNGNIKIVNLCAGEYTLKEEELPENTVFSVDDENLPSLNYIIDCGTGEVVTTSGNRAIIDNEPTRVEINKVIGNLDELITEQATFEIYKCKNSDCSQKTLVKFEERENIGSENAYKYAKNQSSNSSISSLVTQNGQIIIRYLPTGNYVAVEVSAPEGYYYLTPNTNFTVEAKTTNKVNISNYKKYASVQFTKVDFYNSNMVSNEEAAINFDYGAEFVLRDENWNKVKVSRQEAGVGILNRYSIDENGSYTLTTQNGYLYINKLIGNKTYYIEETKAPNNYTLATDYTAPNETIRNNSEFKGHPYVSFIADVDDLGLLQISNNPTEVYFKKVDSETGEVISSDDPGSNTEFEIYQCPKTFGDTFDSNSCSNVKFNLSGRVEYNGRTPHSQEVYVYDSINTSSSSQIIRTYKGNLILLYLPKDYKYFACEVTPPEGYNISSNYSDNCTPFTIDESSAVTSNISNSPVSINLLKNDKYGVYESSEFNNSKFAIKNSSGDYIQVMLDSQNSNDKNVYNYVGIGHYIVGDEESLYITPKNGKIEIKYLPIGTYTIEEISSSNKFVVTSSDSVSYTDTPYVSTSNTKVLSNIPTKIKLIKDDENGNPIVNNPATFNIYKCGETCNEADRTIIKVKNDKQTIENESVYVYSEENGISDLLTDSNGEIIIRYLPVGNYVAIEKTSPTGYYKSQTPQNFTVVNNSTDTEVHVINNETSITFRKTDANNLIGTNVEDILDTAVFQLRDKNFNKLYVSGSNGVYTYSSTNNNVELKTKNASFTISGLTSGETYYIEEIKAPKGYKLTTKETKPNDLTLGSGVSWQGHPYVKYVVSNSNTTQVIENTPTKISFVKYDQDGNQIKLSGIKFKIYQCSINKDKCSTDDLVMKFSTMLVDGKTVYRYDENSQITDVETNNNGEFTILYLPTGYKYLLQEIESGDGYYLQSEDEYRTFVINESEDNATETINNLQTKIIFEKKDIYSYYDNTQEFDSSVFNLKDESGNIINLVYVGIDTTYNYNKYRKATGDPSEQTITSINTKNGGVIIEKLTKGQKYYIEEVSSSNKFIYAENTKSDFYDIKTVQSIGNAAAVVSNLTKSITNTPTKLTIQKVDSDGKAYDTNNNLIIEEATFEIYDTNGNGISFEEKEQIDNEYVYKYSKVQNNIASKVKTNNGKLSLLYMPKGDYIAREVGSPKGYYVSSNESELEVLNTTSLVSIQNYETKIEFSKKDIYSSDEVSKTELDSARFVLRDKDFNIVSVKKIKDGEYILSELSKNNNSINVDYLQTKNGKFTIINLFNNSTYYIEEIKAPEGYVLTTTEEKPNGLITDNWQGHPYVKYIIEKNSSSASTKTNELSNTPTRVEFRKYDQNGSLISNLPAGFKVYKCNDASCSQTLSGIEFTQVSMIEKETNNNSSIDLYTYLKDVDIDNSQTIRTINGRLILRYLPAGYYKLVEVESPYGYYLPEGEDAITLFEVNSSQVQLFDEINNKIINQNTEIVFIKEDENKYYKVTDSDYTIFDSAKFALYNENNELINLVKIGNQESTNYNIYSALIPDGQTSINEINTNNGGLVIKYLEKGKKYYIKEKSSSDSQKFIFDQDNVIKTDMYDIPNSISSIPSINNILSKTISNIPTKLTIQKVDLNSNIINDIVKFNVYQCINEDCTNKNLIKFENIDENNEYKYSKNQNEGIDKVSTVNGKITLRYLPYGFKYAFVETDYPSGYYHSNNMFITDNALSMSSLNDSYDIFNTPIKIYFEKKDIYNYYNSTEQTTMTNNEYILDTAKFVLRNENGKILKLDQESIGNYKYISECNEEVNNCYISTYKGKLSISNLLLNNAEITKYYIEEIESNNQFILPTNVVKPNDISDNWNWKGHPYKEYSLSINGLNDISSITRVISNTPTRVAFEKIDAKTQNIITDEATTFVVKKCEDADCNLINNNSIKFSQRDYIIGDNEDPDKMVYKYSSNSGVTELHPYQGYLILRYLPAGTYVLEETNAPNGYYNPSDKIKFVVKSSSYNNQNDFEEITKIVENTPTQIIFNKKDFYNYYNETDISIFDNNKKIFDTAKFVIRNSIGEILKVEQTNNNVENGNIYKYSGLCGENEDCSINTYNGKLTITNLYRNSTYFIEEIKSTENFVLPNNLQYEGINWNSGHPVVKYILDDNEPELQESITREIENTPTRVRFEKRDSKYNYLISDETTTFELYQCNEECHPSDYVTREERELAGMTLVNFTQRAKLEKSDSTVDIDSDLDLEVYKYSKLNTNKVTSLNPNNGVLILRYLPSGYYYVLLETVAPKNYNLPSGRDRETTFEVSSETTNVEVLDVENKPTSLLIRKYDEEGNLLTGAQFKIYESTTCDASLPLADQLSNEMSFRTIRDGVYENRPKLDTNIITTCSGSSCGEIKLDDNTQLPFEDYESNTKSIEIKEGEALIQYLEYGHCYIIKEEKAPRGYSLPEKEEDRYTMVKINQELSYAQSSYKTLINKPTPFTFYKYDEFNNLLDGAEFKLQKLDNNKKYQDLTVIQEENNGKLYYKVSEDTQNKTITTINGQATVYYLESGQYRIVEIKAAPGKILTKNPNVVTFYVDDSGNVYGNSIIVNKAKTEKFDIKSESNAEFIIGIQTGQTVIKYGLIIGIISFIITSLFLLKKMVDKKED